MCGEHGVPGMLKNLKSAVLMLACASCAPYSTDSICYSSQGTEGITYIQIDKKLHSFKLRNNNSNGSQDIFLCSDNKYICLNGPFFFKMLKTKIYPNLPRYIRSQNDMYLSEFEFNSNGELVSFTNSRVGRFPNGSLGYSPAEKYDLCWFELNGVKFNSVAELR